MTRNVEDDVNLNVTQRYKRLCPILDELATEAADNEEAYPFVAKMAREMPKQVQKIKNVSRVSLDNEPQLSLSNDNEIAKKLLETVKGINKKEGQKGGKRWRGWVEKQPRKKTKITANDNIGKKSSHVIF
jgi:hypothetical protein